MKKIVLLCLACIAFLLISGCFGGFWDNASALGGTDDEKDVKIVEITDEKSSEETDKAGRNGLYYANTKTRKFHLNNCEAAQKIKDENLYITEYRDQLINEGYTPCSICNP